MGLIPVAGPTQRKTLVFTRAFRSYVRETAPEFHIPGEFHTNRRFRVVYRETTLERNRVVNSLSPDPPWEREASLLAYVPNEGALAQPIA